MMVTILLAVCMLSMCSAQERAPNLPDEDDFCLRSAFAPKLAERWPFFGLETGLDDTKLARTYRASDGGHLLEYAPALDACGGKYPIWRKQFRNDTSVVCIKTEKSDCAQEMEIETRICNGVEVYSLRTDFEGSTFCFQPNFCHFQPCQNGGKCVNRRDGYHCECPTGFSGPTCQGDPCNNYRTLPDMDLRSPSNTVPHSYNDTIAPGWYEAPMGWTMADSDPYFACGTEFSLYTLATDGDMMLMCESFFTPGQCYQPFVLKTLTCGQKQLYGIFHLNGLVTHCFECTPFPLDVLIIEDVSTSVMKHDYIKMKEFVMQVVSGLDISPKGTNVAFMSVGQTAKVGFHLNAYQNESTLLAALAAQRGTGGRTVLGDAILLAVSDIFEPAHGDRAEAPNVVLIFTDGKANGGANIYRNSWRLSMRAQVIVVAVTSDVNVGIMRTLASNMHHVLDIKDQNAITLVKNGVTPCKRYIGYRPQ
ncbi:uncharacterized protein LOC124134497 [Haliotis rufescens]|uniref:uncharacterized protein LOC124134497 n=1 Tax=Haliotis rufescens TaxID=6454 RepID=UPI00201ECB3A|nr:uncharacterized protein LOC124134497 [Haliotis rufescens]